MAGATANEMLPGSARHTADLPIVDTLAAVVVIEIDTMADAEVSHSKLIFNAEIYVNETKIGVLTTRGIQVDNDHTPIPSPNLSHDPQPFVVIKKTARRILTVDKFHVRMPRSSCKRLNILFTGHRIELVIDDKVVFGGEKKEYQYTEEKRIKRYDPIAHLRYDTWCFQSSKILPQEHDAERRGLPSTTTSK
jgi:hypothetical protein